MTEKENQNHHSSQEKSFSVRSERSQRGVCLKSSTIQQVTNPLIKRSSAPENKEPEQSGHIQDSGSQFKSEEKND